MDSNYSIPTATAQSSPPSLEELAMRSVRTTLLPYAVDVVSSAETPSRQPIEVSVIVNPRTRTLTFIEGSPDADGLFRSKDGCVPASKESVDALPLVKVAQEGLDCAICLAEFEVGEVAKQMPCKHRYHAGCIDKWLAIHGACPFCRYRMPVEEEEENKKEGGGGNGSDGEAGEDEEEEEEEVGGGIGSIPGFEFHIYFAQALGGRRNSDSESGEGNESGDGNSGSTLYGHSTQNMDVDSGSPSQDMDIDRNTS